jgi:pimeloyl-ACP methyl ester carboxylesterase
VGVTELTIPVPGGEVWAEDTGGDRPPILLLHPGVGDSRIWEPLMPALTATHRVIRYDSRGYGRSPAATTEFRPLRDCEAVLDFLSIGRTPVVGCSQGGGTAIGLALAQPQRVSALILLCPGISGFAWPPEPEVDAAFEAAVAEGPQALTELGLKLWAAGGATPEAVEQMRSASQAWASSSMFQRDDPPVFDRLGELAVPTSLMIGDLDRPALIASNLEAADRIPGCELIEVAGLDHLPPLRVPDLVLRQITDTLARV